MTIKEVIEKRVDDMTKKLKWYVVVYHDDIEISATLKGDYWNALAANGFREQRITDISNDNEFKKYLNQ